MSKHNPTTAQPSSTPVIFDVISARNAEPCLLASTPTIEIIDGQPFAIFSKSKPERVTNIVATEQTAVLSLIGGQDLIMRREDVPAHLLIKPSPDAQQTALALDYFHIVGGRATVDGVYGVFTEQTDRGVVIGLVGSEGDRSELDLIQPGYVVSAAIVGPVVTIIATKPAVILTAEQAAEFDMDSFDVESTCYVIPAAELPNHPALAALVNPRSPAPVARKRRNRAA